MGPEIVCCERAKEAGVLSIVSIVPNWNGEGLHAWVMYLPPPLDEGIKVEFCPFCGTKLPPLGGLNLGGEDG